MPAGQETSYIDISVEIQRLRKMAALLAEKATHVDVVPAASDIALLFAAVDDLLDAGHLFAGKMKDAPLPGDPRPQAP
jgi:hypothetical protein